MTADIQGRLGEVLGLAELRRPLPQILAEVLDLWPAEVAVVTSAVRTAREDRALGGSGVHPAGRAVDLRTRDLPGGPSAALPVADAINRRWIYDPRRPEKPVALAQKHGTGPHLHLQVHPATRRREVEP